MHDFLSFHWFSVGALTIILGFAIFQYLNIRQSEFIYFALYLIFILIGTAGSYYFVNHYHSDLNKIMFGICNTTAHICSFILSILFMRKLLDLKTMYPSLNKLANGFVVALLIYLVIDLYLAIFFRNNFIRYQLYNGVRMALIVFTFISAFLIFKKGDRTAKFFLIGLLSYVLMGALATFFQILEPVSPKGNGVFSAYAYRTGILIQILFFSAGLSQKIKQILIQQALSKQQLEGELHQKEFENKAAILSERKRISQDMHDDLGSGLAKIAILSEVMKLRHQDAQSSSNLDKISASAKEALENIGEIVWSLNPRNDSLQNLAYYLRKHSVEFLEPLVQQCNIKMSPDIPAITILGEHRRNILLCVKESLHNVVKHSGANKVDLSFLKTDQGFEINIHDNGKGIDVTANQPWGNGLINMKNRISSIGGTFSIECKNGTQVRMVIPIS